MRKYTWIFVASLTAVAPWACVETTFPGTPTGVGGAGSSGVTTGTKPSTTKATSTSTSTGGALSCEGNFKPACNECIVTSCCAEFAECLGLDGCEACVDGQPTCTDDNFDIAKLTFDCMQSSCEAECFPPVDPICKVPTGSPSEGACAPLGGKVTCNPVTNAPCNTVAGEACDFTDQDEFICFPAPNTEALCAACDNKNKFCQAGLTCVVNGGQCARYCCDDSDCGAGKCDKGAMEFPLDLGVCVVNNEAPDGGADGGGTDGGPVDGGVSSAASGGPVDGGGVGGGSVDGGGVGGGPIDGGSVDGGGP